MPRFTTSRTIAGLLAGALACVVAGLAPASDGVYTDTAHGDPFGGVQRVTGEPRGDCAHCHDQHASRDGFPTGGPYEYLLFAPNDDQLCGSGTACHASAGALGIFPGPTIHDDSSHSTSPAMVWPGPDPRARAFGDAGLCVNCHTPHGRGDGLGTIPSLVAVREEGSCLTCHDVSGPAMTDVDGEMRKPSAHPTSQFGRRHSADEGGNPTAFGIGKRHAECEDCHNPHDVRPDSGVPVPPTASNRTQRVGRVAVSNGSAGTIPAYSYRSADDPSPVLEYELCFKCHSSWTTRPGGQPDLAQLMNPQNPSYHPVEAQGSDPNLRPGSFVAPWQPDSLVYCSSCHGSDDTRVVGPHGSIHMDLLRSPYSPFPGFREMQPDELCFRCHSFSTYADHAGPVVPKAQSRWNATEEFQGHTYHVGNRDIPCYTCHETHGSTTLPSLIATGRFPGLVSYTQNATGGTCTPTCHSPESYLLNYPR